MNIRCRAHFRQVGLALLLALGLGLWLFFGATAHPSLRANEASPGPGDLLSSSPQQVKLVFNVELQGLVPWQSFFWVIQEKGLKVVALGQVDLNAPDRDVMIAKLPQLEPGVYQVKWVAVSKADQGFSEGSYSFAVTGQ